MRGELDDADALFRLANIPEIYDWGHAAWNRPAANIRFPDPDGRALNLRREQLDPLRQPTEAVKTAVRSRDGYRCRYCGIPVVDAAIRKIAHELYPGSVPWGKDYRDQHAAFQCFWLQYDHVVPHSHGGSTSEDNIVVCCHLCNFGKDHYTLRQLGISDPRLRPPEPVSWDGLERLRGSVLPRRKQQALVRKVDAVATGAAPLGRATRVFFFPGAHLQGQYLVTPSIAGKPRWFQVGPDVVAEPASRNGIEGYCLRCDPTLLRRRGISPDLLLDPEQHPVTS